MSIVVENLVKTFGTQNAVNGISFEAKRGEILGFLGPNGAGKSTTMKIATCYLPPTSGTVSVAGYDVVNNPIEVRQRVGYLPEHNPLYLDMYVHEYLGFSAGIYGYKGVSGQKRVQEMIETVGLTREQNKKIGSLSKGYRQRVGLAQALIHDPEVLILDEPTTGLDPNQIVEIRQVIKQISLNKTVIFSTHIMQEVQALCDKVVIINLGQIVAYNAVQELKDAYTNVQIRAAFSREVARESFLAIDGCLEVTAEGNGRYLVAATKDIREDIFNLAVKEQAALSELVRVETSLEAVFQQLTRKTA